MIFAFFPFPFCWGENFSYPPSPASSFNLIVVNDSYASEEVFDIYCTIWTSWFFVFRIILKVQVVLFFTLLSSDETVMLFYQNAAALAANVTDDVSLKVRMGNENLNIAKFYFKDQNSGLLCWWYLGEYW